MAEPEIKHEYAIELDVIATAGEIALKKIGEEGNVIYLDFETLERRAADKKDSDRHAFEEVLGLITETCEFEPDKKRAYLPSGGIISWDNPNGTAQHITRCVATKSRLKRQKKLVDFPRFLVYGHEVLTQGVIDVNYNGVVEEMTFQNLMDTGLHEDLLMNNQFFKINGRTDHVYQLQHKLISNIDGSRYRVNEDVDPEFAWMNPHNFTSRVPGFKPRNLEQKLAFVNAIRNDIEVHVITGGSGSGKTVTAYAAAVHHILGTETQRKDGEIKDRIVLFKSNDIIGGKNREEGFLPGTTEQKNWPFMKSYKDAHDLIGLGYFRPFEKMLLPPEKEEIKDDNYHNAGKSKSKSTSHKAQVKIDNKLGDYYLPARTPAIETEQLIYARGRTFENCVIFIDEAQNYTPYEMKQLIERAGRGSVIYIVGDPEQRDNPLLSEDYNGLTYAANIFFRDHPRFSMVNLDKNYRLQAAEIMRSHKAPRD